MSCYSSLEVAHIKYEKSCVKYLMFYSAWLYKILTNTNSSSVKHFITLGYKFVNPHADLWCFSQHFSKVQGWIIFLSCFRLFTDIGGINNYIFSESLLSCIKATKLHPREKILLSFCNISTGRIAEGNLIKFSAKYSFPVIFLLCLQRCLLDPAK